MTESSLPNSIIVPLIHKNNYKKTKVTIKTSSSTSKTINSKVNIIFQLLQQKEWTISSKCTYILKKKRKKIRAALLTSLSFFLLLRNTDRFCKKWTQESVKRRNFIEKKNFCSPVSKRVCSSPLERGIKIRTSVAMLLL